MNTSLPFELLTMILEEYINDKTTLHTCILVNRNWCSVAIQYLWANPFTLLCKNRMSYGIPKTRQAEKLMTIFIECFTDASEILDELGCLDKRINKRLPFNYDDYLKELDYKDIKKVVEDWLSGITVPESKIEMTTVRVFSLAIQHCRRLQTLNFNTEKSPACSQLHSCLSSVQSLPYLRNFTWRSRRSYR